MKKMKITKKLFTFFQVFLVVISGVFVTQFFTNNTSAQGCAPTTWDCTFQQTDISASLPITWAGVPMTMTEFKTYTFSYTVHIKQQRPGTTGDTFGLTISQIVQSPKGTNINPTNNNITVTDLSIARNANNDNQVAVDNHMNPIAAGSSWAGFQCSGTVVNDANYALSTVSRTCTFTPQHTGFIQVDANSLNYFNVSGQQNCENGFCGAIAAFFAKIVPPAATPTPTPTPTPTVTPSVMCTAISLNNQATGQTYTNGQQIATSLDANGNPINLSINAIVAGTSNQGNVQVKWTLNTQDLNAKTSNTTVSNTRTAVASSNGTFSNTFNFPFGQIKSSNGTVLPNDSFLYSITPTITFTSDGETIAIPTPPLCNAQLTTTSGSVKGNTTTASVSVNKSLIETNQVLSVGQNADFKIVITNNGTEALTSVNFKDNFDNNGVVAFKSASVVETNSGVASASQNLPITATNGTTNSIDLISLAGFRQLAPNDSFTITITFTGASGGSNTDCAVANTTSQSGAQPSGSNCASVTFSPPPSSPNTGASTPLTLGALAMLLASVSAKKYILKFVAA